MSSTYCLQTHNAFSMILMLADSNEFQSSLHGIPPAVQLPLFDTHLKAQSCYAAIVSPVEVIKAVFTKIKKNNDQVNAFSYLNEELAIAAAEKSEKRWLLPRNLLQRFPEMFL